MSGIAAIGGVDRIIVGRLLGQLAFTRSGFKTYISKVEAIKEIAGIIRSLEGELASGSA